MCTIFNDYVHCGTGCDNDIFFFFFLRYWTKISQQTQAQVSAILVTDCSELPK